jgi:hemerythrin
MSTIRWDPALAIGHAGIDGQHEELFRRLDALVDAMASRERAEIGSLFDFLGAYVVEHFVDEERLMAENGFPGYGVHKAAHDRFVRDYHALRALFDRHGPTAAVSVKTRIWLFDWLRAHIASVDQQMARHVLRKTA